jgi:HK97 family phage prohead protease
MYLEKNLDLEYKQSNRSFDIQEDGTFEGYGAVFGNQDHNNDIILKGAFLESLKKNKKPKLLWQHNQNEPVGVIDEIKEDDIGLYIKGKIAINTDTGKKVYELLKIGAIEGLSIGYFIKVYEFDKKQKIRFLKQIDVFEISFVTFPANELATVSKIKSAVSYQDLPLASREREWDKTSALSRVKSFTNSEDEPSRSYRRAFLYFDAENAENFGAYKLPIADVINNKLTAVPRAIFAAAAALRGARGGVKIPSSDKTKIINNINRYYTKIREKFDDDSIESPFKKSISDFDSIREFEKFLENPYPLSQKERKIFISRVKSFKRDANCEDEKKRDVLDIKYIYDIDYNISKLKNYFNNNKKRI